MSALAGIEWHPMAQSAVDVFEKSYNEVLSALKHQDDKLNRSLTALAFLTAAALTLATRVEDLERESPMDFGSGPPPTDALLVTFVFAVALALVQALVAIGPSGPLRWPDRGPGTPGGSLTFWGEIAKTPKEHWEGLREAEAAYLEAKLGEHLNREAREMSQRVVFKVAQSRRSAAFLQLAVISLGLLGVFAVGGLSPEARWWVALALLPLVLTLPFVELITYSRSDFPEAPTLGAYTWLAIATAPAVALLLVATSGDHRWAALYTALAVVVAARLSVSSETVARWLLPGTALASAASLAFTLL
jgi:hypothetical protein